MSKTILRSASDSYFTLVKQFPLRPLRNEREYDAAVEIMNTLAMRNEGTLDSGEQDYLDTITLLVEAFDNQNLRIDTSYVTPLELLKHLLENRGFSVSDLGKIIGSQPLASMILAGKREISREKAKLLGAYFSVEPGAFF